MNIGNRIKLVRKSSGYTQQKFADKIGLKRNTIANYEIGQIQPSDRTIADICRAFNVSEEWLRTGSGDMFIELSDNADFLRIMTQIQVSDDELIKSILSAYWELDETKKAAIKELIDGFIKKYKEKSE